MKCSAFIAIASFEDPFLMLSAEKKTFCWREEHLDSDSVLFSSSSLPSPLSLSHSSLAVSLCALSPLLDCFQSNIITASMMLKCKIGRKFSHLPAPPHTTSPLFKRCSLFHCFAVCPNYYWTTVKMRSLCSCFASRRAN